MFVASVVSHFSRFPHEHSLQRSQEPCQMASDGFTHCRIARFLAGKALHVNGGQGMTPRLMAGYLSRVHVHRVIDGEHHGMPAEVTVNMIKRTTLPRSHHASGCHSPRKDHGPLPLAVAGV